MYKSKSNIFHRSIVAALIFPFTFNLAFASLSDDLQNGGLVVLGDVEDDDELGYTLITANPDDDNLQFQSFILDFEALEFVEIQNVGEEQELVLTSNGWQQTSEDYVVTEFDGDSFSVAASAGENISISGTPLDLQGKTFGDFVATFIDQNDDEDYAVALLSWSILIDPAFTFSGDATAYVTDFTSITDTYYLWLPPECENKIDNECWYTYVQNSDQPNGAISSIDDIFTETAWNEIDPTQLLSVQIAWGQTGVLLAEFVTSDSASGVVNYYFQNHFNNTATKISQGQWQLEQKQGTELLILELSENTLNAAEGLVEIEDSQLLFSVYGGYVRNGGYELAGQVDSEEHEIWLNNAAIEELAGAFGGGNLAEDMQNGGMAVLGETPDDDELGYLLISTNTQNNDLQFQSFVYDMESLDFVEVQDDGDDDELVLGANGWQQSPNDYSVIEADGNLVSVANSAGESIAINGTLLNLHDLEFAIYAGLLFDFDFDFEDYYDYDFGLLNWFLYVDPEFTFSGDAAVYLTNFVSLNDAYFLWVSADCENSIDDECWYTYVQQPGQEDGAITSLDDVFATTEWNGIDQTQLHAAHIAWGQSAMLMAEFVASETDSGLVNFYLQNYSDFSVTKINQGLWSRVQRGNAELLLLELDDTLLDDTEGLVDIDSSQLLFSEFGGYVRNGGYDLAGQLDDEEQQVWINDSALEQLKDALIIEQRDSDEDGVIDSEDAFPNDPTESVDTDGDLIGNNADNDDDGDLYLDTDETAAGSDPLDNSSLPLDTDGDYISNATDLDDDNDGVSDVDELAAGTDPLDPSSVPQNLEMLAFDDISGDSVQDWLGYEVQPTEVHVNVFSGDDFVNLGSFSLAHTFTAATLHKLGDRNSDGVSELGVFGFDAAANRYQLLVYKGTDGQKLATWNWPATLDNVKLEVLADLTDDGVQEYGINGIHKVNGTRQLVVRNGATRAPYQTFKWPNLWEQTRIVTMSDMTDDGIPEVALYGRHVRIGKGQLFVYDGASAATKVEVYNWNKLWDDIQLFKMDDVDGEGTIDWGQFGKRKDDGRYQWIIKKGHDKRGVIRTFSWPADLENVTPILVADRTGDGVRDVAITGTHKTNGKIFLRINDGKLANQRIANIGWPANWEDHQIKELGDLNGDGFNEYAMLGYLKSNRTVQLVIKDGQALTEFGRYTLEGDFEELMLSSYDVNGDGVDDVVISGVDRTTDNREYNFLDGTNLDLLWQR